MLGFTGLPNWKRVRYAAALLNSDKLLSDMCKFEAEINLNGKYQELSSEQSRPVEFQRLKSTTLVGENTVVDGMTSRFRPCFFYITGRRPKTICFFHFFHMRFPSSRKSQGPNFRFVDNDGPLAGAVLQTKEIFSQIWRKPRWFSGVLALKLKSSSMKVSWWWLWWYSTVWFRSNEVGVLCQDLHSGVKLNFGGDENNG